MSGPTNASATVIFANLARPLLVSFRAPAFFFPRFSVCTVQLRGYLPQILPLTFFVLKK